MQLWRCGSDGLKIMGERGAWGLKGRRTGAQSAQCCDGADTRGAAAGWLGGLADESTAGGVGGGGSMAKPAGFLQPSRRV